MQSLQDYAVLPKVVFLTRKSRELGKIASAGSGAIAENALREKVATDTALVDELLKLGSRLICGLKDGETILKQIEQEEEGPEQSETKLGFWPSAGKGLAYATGAAIPAGMLGSYLIDREGAEREKRIKNVLLPMAGTVLGTTAGMMGLQRLNDGTKTSSVESDLYEKFATAVEARTHIHNTMSESDDGDVRKLAAETLVVANAHIADIAGDVLLDKSAASFERAKTASFEKTAAPGDGGMKLDPSWSPTNYRASTNPLHAQLSDMGDRRFWSGYGYDPFRAGETYADKLEGTQVPDYEMPQVQGYQGVAGTTPVQHYEGTAPPQGGG